MGHYTTVVKGTGTSIRSVGRQEVQKPEVLYKGYKNIRQWRIRQWERVQVFLLHAPVCTP